MSISAMRYALQALEDPWGSGPEGVANAIAFLRQAIAEAEKQPVHASDISQERADETAKHRHELVGQPDLARVGEVGVWGDKREWVGLTDEERRSIQEWQRIQEELGPVWAPMMLYLYLAIEAKLKEKNT